MASAKKISDFIHVIEQEFGLLHRPINGVYAWPLSRITIYYALTMATGTYQDNIADTGKAEPKWRRLTRLLGQFINNPFFNLSAKPYALYVHSRKVGGKDIYSHALMHELGNQVLVLDSTFTGSGRLKSARDMAFFTALAVLYRRFKLRQKVLSPDDKALIENIKVRMREELGADIDLQNILLRRLYLFSFLKPVYKALFKMKKTRHVYLVNGYSYHYITAAAQELGVSVSELQHGMLTPYHMGYSYPGQKRVPYFPDEFLGFGQYWLDAAPMPTETKKRVIGAPHIAHLTARDIEKTPKSIFFSSQTVIGQDVFTFACKTAALLPDYKITLNLHPSDNRDLYPVKDLPANLDILYRPDNFFELLARHEFQAGSFSTILFEGMMLGNKIIVLDLSGSENMVPVIERGDAILAATPEDLTRMLEQAKMAADPCIYYSNLAEKIIL